MATPGERRFSTGAVVGGAVLGFLGPVVVLPIVFALASVIIGPLALGLLVVGFLAPLIGGVILVRRPEPQQRGLGLGLIIGWATLAIVGGGLCIALLSTLP